MVSGDGNSGRGALGGQLAAGGRISDNVGGMLTGVGMGLFGFGFSQFKMRRWEEKDPQQMRKAEIEANDERNVPSAAGAQAVSGEVLQWTVLAAAWVVHCLWRTAVG